MLKFQTFPVQSLMWYNFLLFICSCFESIALIFHVSAILALSLPLIHVVFEYIQINFKRLSFKRNLEHPILWTIDF